MKILIIQYLTANNCEKIVLKNRNCLRPTQIYNQNYNTCTPTDSNKGVYHSEIISAFQCII